MASSTTRSSWSGTLSLDLLSIPVTLARTAREDREESIRTLCVCHHEPIDKSERCSQTNEHGPDKIKGVKLTDGTYRVIPENEWAAVEDATKDDALEILDVQPLSEFPMAFSTTTYYVRAKKDDRAAAGALGAMVAGMGKARMGAVVKVCKAAKQDLAILWSYQGYALLSYIPFKEQFVRPGTQERAHMQADVPEATVDRVVDLLKAHQNSEGFAWADFENTGLKLRQSLVDRALADEQFAEAEAKVETPDLMAALEASLRAAEQKAAA